MPAEAIVEFIIEIIGRMVLSVIEYPGAWIHWQIKNERLPFKEMVEKYFGINLLISCVIYIIIVLLII